MPRLAYGYALRGRMEFRLRWTVWHWTLEVVDVARPMSDKGIAVLNLMDGIVVAEWGMQAIRDGRKEVAMGCFQIVRVHCKQAAAKIERLSTGTPNRT